MPNLRPTTSPLHSPYTHLAWFAMMDRPRSSHRCIDIDIAISNSGHDHAIHADIIRGDIGQEDSALHVGNSMPTPKVWGASTQPMGKHVEELVINGTKFYKKPDDIVVFFYPEVLKPTTYARVRSVEPSHWSLCKLALELEFGDFGESIKRVCELSMSWPSALVAVRNQQEAKRRFEEMELNDARKRQRLSHGSS